MGHGDVLVGSELLQEHSPSPLYPQFWDLGWDGIEHSAGALAQLHGSEQFREVRSCLCPVTTVSLQPLCRSVGRCLLPRRAGAVGGVGRRVAYFCQAGWGLAPEARALRCPRAR